jgi:hypothetical protein
MVKVDTTVKFLNLPENINILNKLGSLSVVFTQSQEALVINSLLTINYEVVLQEKFKDVLELYNAVRKLNSTKLYFVIN